MLFVLIKFHLIVYSQNNLKIIARLPCEIILIIERQFQMTCNKYIHISNMHTHENKTLIEAILLQLRIVQLHRISSKENWKATPVARALGIEAEILF